MRRVEFKMCRECKEIYRWESGGIIVTPQDHVDLGLCKKCRTKQTMKAIARILGGKKR